MKVTSLSTVTRIVLLAAFYFISGLLGKQSTFMGGNIALVWPPSGIALAAILLFGYRFWFGVAAGALLFATINGTPFSFFTVATAIGNTVGAVVCAFLLERFTRFRNPMERLRDVVGFIIFACVLGTTVNALFNVAGLHLPMDQMFSSLWIWWVPNAMGVLVVTPLILAWGSPSAIQWRPGLTVEALICFGGLIAGTLVSFNSWYVYGIENYPLAYLPYPFLVWAALRFGQRGATTGTFLVTALAIYELLQKQGPFFTGHERTSLMLIGCYISVLAISNLLLAGAAVERGIAVRTTEESERRYRAVVEDQTDLICRFNPDGTLTFVNQAYCRFHGKGSGQLLGTNFFPAFEQQDREIPLSHFSSLTPGEPTLSFDDKVLLSTGKFVWQQCTVRALFDEHARIIEFQAVIQDITRRKQSEEATRLGEERLRAILNSMVDGVVVLDHRGLITSFNPAAEIIFRRPSTEVVGLNMRDMFSPSDRAKYDLYLDHHLGSTSTTIIEVNALRPEGAVTPIDLAVSEISLGGSLMNIVVVRDISERKKLEEQYRQSQKMEAIGRLAGGIAHDFNNLMQAILGYSNLIEINIAPNDPNHEPLQQIQKSVDHATSLTRQLLAFSRKQVLKPKILSLNAVVGDLNKLLRRLIGETIHLRVNLDSTAPYVRADPGQVEQMLLNLAINARDAMANVGTLTITTSNADSVPKQPWSTNDLKPGPYAVISITDTGSGMSNDVLAHLFEPFFTTKEVGKGTGLGLSIVFGIVKQSGGEIMVQTEVGRGTTMKIFLPCVEPDETVTEDRPQDSPRPKGTETILLVEDEELVRLMLVEVLKSEGYAVLDAKDGAEALTLADKHNGPIDLLVTDMTMPGLSGWELAGELAKTRSSTPVLYISGYSDEEAILKGNLEKSAEFLQKPFHSDAFLLRTRQILDVRKKKANQSPAV